MPQVATWEETRYESWSMPDDDWAALRSSYRASGLVMSCGTAGVPVELKSGTRFFRHKSACDLHEGGPETAEHLTTKAVVARIARELGWEATIEAAALDRSWIADVLLEKNGRRVAVEVQWSPQSTFDFERRTARYEQDGIRCQWLVGPKNHDVKTSSTTALIAGTYDALTMNIPSSLGSAEDVPLEEGLRHLLSGGIRPRYEGVVDAVEVTTCMSKCHNDRCNVWFSYWYLSAVQVATRCGLHGHIPFASRYPTHVQDRPEVLVQHDIQTAFDRSGRPSATRYRRVNSKTTNQEYTAQTCPGCGWHLGDGFIVTPYRDWQEFQMPITATRMPLSPEATAAMHLCIDSGRGRCAPVAAEGVTFPSSEITSGIWITSNHGGTWPGPLDAPPLPLRKQLL